MSDDGSKAIAELADIQAFLKIARHDYLAAGGSQFGLDAIRRRAHKRVEQEAAEQEEIQMSDASPTVIIDRGAYEVLKRQAEAAPALVARAEALTATGARQKPLAALSAPPTSPALASQASQALDAYTADLTDSMLGRPGARRYQPPTRWGAMGLEFVPASESAQAESRDGMLRRGEVPANPVGQQPSDAALAGYIDLNRKGAW